MRMFHQIGRLRPFTLWLGLAGLSCNHDPTRHFSFDGPEWSDVLQPEEGGPFWTPIGFVGNSRDGTITPLDLRRGSLLGDQYGSPFTRPRVIATGEMRQLGQLVAWAPSDTEVQVFAADLAFGVLIEATYIEDMVAGEPLPPLPLASDPVFFRFGRIRGHISPTQRPRTPQGLHHHRRLAAHLRRRILDCGR